MAELTPYRKQVVDLIRSLPAHVTGAEVGVHRGRTSAAILRECKNVDALYMIDTWTTHEPGSSYYDSGDPTSRHSQVEQEEFYRESQRVTDFAFGRRRILRLDSVSAVIAIPEQLDFVFIDGDHSERGVRRDVHTYWSKLKPGGLCAGHDYRPHEDGHTVGVKVAVDEFVAEQKVTLNLGVGSVWWVWKPDAIFHHPV